MYDLEDDNFIFGFFNYEDRRRDVKNYFGFIKI